MKTQFSRCVLRVLIAFWLVAIPIAGRAALVTYTLTITNTPLPGSGTNLTVNGVTRNWTNVASASGIQTNSAGLAASATNLFRSYASFPVTGVTVYQSATNIVVFRGLDITLTQGGIWASVAMTSDPGTTTSASQLPYSAAVASQIWTNLDLLSTNRGLHRVDFNAGLGLHGQYLVATNYTLTTNDLYLGVDTRANTNLILTLPTAASATNLLFYIKDEGGSAGTNTIKIYPQTGDRIDTLLTNLVISNNFGGVMLRSRGSTNWAIIASGGGVTGGIASSGIAGVALTNSVWVAKNGSDSTGARGDPAKAFLTLTAAKTAASAGDTIFAMPGVFVATNLVKDGVNWHLFNGTTFSNNNDSYAMFDFNAVSGSFNVTGEGEFLDNTNGAGGIIFGDTGSTASFKFRRMWSDGCPASFFGGTYTLTGDLIETAGNIGSIGAVRIGNAAAVVNIARTKIRSNSTGGNARAINYTAANTNLTLSDCTLLAGSGANAINGTGTTKIAIEGTLTANAGFSGVTLLNSTNTTTVPGNLTANRILLGTNSNTLSAPFYAEFDDNDNKYSFAKIVNSVPGGLGTAEKILVQDGVTPFTGSDATALRALVTASSGQTDHELYYTGAVGVKGHSQSQSTNGTAVGVSGASFGQQEIQIGIRGITEANRDGQTNVAVAALAQHFGKTGVHVGLYAEIGNDESVEPSFESAVALLENRDSALPLLIARDNGVTKFSVSTNGTASVKGGVASTDTTAAVAIAATGWTNLFSKNATVFVSGTAVTFTVKNNAGTPVFTNAVAFTGAIPIPIQSGGAVVTSGTGVTGFATPF